MLYALLRAKGLSVGRYTSPHLLDFRERIVVDDEQIGADEVVGFLRQWESESERLGATFFELTTVMAFDHFARRGVDVAVVETGLGGRLDATNVVAPVVTGVTSVGLDHMEYLGNTLTDIAREKAGIFKRGVPAVIGVIDGEAGEELRRCAAEAGAPLVQASTRFAVRGIEVTGEGTDVEFATASGAQRVRLGLVGRAQAGNAAVALAMLEAAGPEYAATPDEVTSVLPDVRIPGRFQRIGKFVLDVAHNLEGMNELRATLESVALPGPLTAVVGILRDKPWAEMVRALAPVADQVVLTRPSSAPAERVWDLHAVEQEVSNLSGRVAIIPEVETALRRAGTGSGTVLVTGSFYTVGEALAFLQAEGSS